MKVIIAHDFKGSASNEQSITMIAIEQSAIATMNNIE